MVRLAATAFTEFFRALPLLLLVFFAFLGLPRFGIDVGPFGALVIALTLYNGSVMAEIFRAGVAAVPHGQVEAAFSLGLSKSTVFRRIQFPQAVRIMLPSLISQMVVLLKDTSLGFIVAYEELLRSGRLIYTNIGNVIPTAIVVAADLHHHQPGAVGRGGVGRAAPASFRSGAGDRRNRRSDRDRGRPGLTSRYGDTAGSRGGSDLRRRDRIRGDAHRMSSEFCRWMRLARNRGTGGAPVPRLGTSGRTLWVRAWVGSAGRT